MLWPGLLSPPGGKGSTSGKPELALAAFQKPLVFDARPCWLLS